MDKTRLLHYLSLIDLNLDSQTELVLYGSAAFILLDEDNRTSLDIDIAAPYSTVSYETFCNAAAAAGLCVNPEEITENDHIEWVSSLRLCLARPVPETEILLWQGQHLTVKTVAPEDLVASKLIRYDAIDASDVRFLVTQMKLSVDDIVDAVERLPKAFRNDVVVHENLKNLSEDMKLWLSQD